MAQATPIGNARAGKILDEHPDAPRPILGGDRPGSKAIYSLIQTRRFWLGIAENGLPPIVGIKN
ncbi:hypothetical protein [Variovorax soli]|uniref:hypothetical protein n=1 Tax=Variovorax soli TaxID=376815 RepID=UPI000838EFEC|nr:hypothetical protein [Variovorax soli]